MQQDGVFRHILLCPTRSWSRSCTHIVVFEGMRWDTFDRSPVNTQTAKHPNCKCEMTAIPCGATPVHVACSRAAAPRQKPGCCGLSDRRRISTTSPTPQPATAEVARWRCSAQWHIFSRQPLKCRLSSLAVAPLTHCDRSVAEKPSSPTFESSRPLLPEASIMSEPRAKRPKGPDVTSAVLEGVPDGDPRLESLTAVQKAKLRASYMAVDDHIQDGQVVGVGSGSTVVFMVQRLAERVSKEGIKVHCVPTSFQVSRPVTPALRPTTCGCQLLRARDRAIVHPVPTPLLPRFLLCTSAPRRWASLHRRWCFL